MVIMYTPSEVPAVNFPVLSIVPAAALLSVKVAAGITLYCYLALGKMITESFTFVITSFGIASTFFFTGKKKNACNKKSSEDAFHGV